MGIDCPRSTSDLPEPLDEAAGCGVGDAAGSVDRVDMVAPP